MKGRTGRDRGGWRTGAACRRRNLDIWSFVLAFAVGVLFLSPRAFAQIVLTPNPAVLQTNQLDGASITLQAPAGGRFGFGAAQDHRWSASGAPAGVTVTVGDRS